MHKYFLLLSLCLFSCGESAEINYANDGVSLVSPKGWQITDEENLDDLGFSLSIEKDGFDSSGLLSITWLNAEVDLDSWLISCAEELKNNVITGNSNLSLGLIHDSEFSSFATRAISYNMSLLGVDHSGIIHVFRAKEKTLAILWQEADEDSNENKIGFEIIENSLRVN